MLISLFLNNLSLTLLIVGFWGLVVVKSNLILILISVELIIFALSIKLLLVSALLDDILGQILSLFLLTVAAAESAIGLAILVVYYKLRGAIKNLFVSTLKS